MVDLTEKAVIVIHETDLVGDQIVIGVADSVKNANIFVKEYYEDYEIIEHNYIGDSNIEEIFILEVEDCTPYETYEVSITYEWFRINKII